MRGKRKKIDKTGKECAKARWAGKRARERLSRAILNGIRKCDFSTVQKRIPTLCSTKQEPVYFWTL